MNDLGQMDGIPAGSARYRSRGRGFVKDRLRANGESRFYDVGFSKLQAPVSMVSVRSLCSK